MVGVPRSRGCKTCRRKKIKCDEQRPRCGQCRKGVRECEGYSQPTIFYNTSSGDFGHAPSAHGLKSIRFRNQFTEDLAWVNGHSEVSDNRKAVVRSNQPSRRAQPYTLTRAERALRGGAVPPSRDLGMQAWALENILSQFLEICLPVSATQEAPLAWVGSLVPMKKNVDALPLAISALAFGWAGHVNNQPQLVDKGLQLYNAAIQQLRNDLNASSPLQMLATTAIFVAFELCEFGSEDNPGWQTHMQGIAALLQSLGPEMVATDPFLQIYSFCRIVFIIQGLSRRRSVCAGSLRWKTVPFRNREKNAYHRFYDLAAEACELFECADALEQPTDGPQDPNLQTMPPTQVLCGIMDLISRLRAFMRDAEISTMHGPPAFPDSSSVAKNQLERATARGYPTKLPVGREWMFDAIQGQRLVHVYWTVILGLYMTILDNQILCSLLEKSGDIQAQLIAELDIHSCKADRSATALVTEECRRLANNIAVYSTWACQNVCQSFGSLISVFTLETAIRWYEDHRAGAGQMEADLEEHCRALLRGIKAEESKDPCAFEVTILPEDVLRRRWC
ncbi:hypothetical protein F5Y19DRAFT_463038 [Xylariaceae sp. FL1651]|nr:hypothetical protein F5Y19DRAFT_463038 [Xylariaceae sp. FL1651]